VGVRIDRTGKTATGWTPPVRDCCLENISPLNHVVVFICGEGYGMDFGFKREAGRNIVRVGFIAGPGVTGHACIYAVSLIYVVHYCTIHRLDKYDRHVFCKK
jgi:hypothetical protein